MNKLFKSILMLISISICSISFVKAELLIVKQTNNGFAPLDDSDIKNYYAISDILLKYQWPMCIANDQLTQQERDELLSPDRPYSEERFIQRKLREAFPSSSKYSAIFIPTALYELFCILHVFRHKWTPVWKKRNKGTVFVKAIEKAINLMKYPPRRNLPNIPRLKVLLPAPEVYQFYIDSDDTPTNIRKNINNAYTRYNDIFYKRKNKVSASLLINSAIANMIFDVNPEFKMSLDEQALSREIETVAGDWTISLLKEISEQDTSTLNNLIFSKFKPGSAASQLILSQSIRRLEFILKNNLSNNRIIPKIIALEYEARKKNKALLMRASSFEHFQVGVGQNPKSRQLAGSTLHMSETQFEEGKKGPIKYGFEEAYKKGKNLPYSISFGTSLFAGIINDLGACVFNYLSGNKTGENTSPSGYALEIDKKAYIEHQLSNLFFIPPLSPMAAIFQEGEFFHARTKAAVSLKKGQLIFIRGFSNVTPPFKDRTGVILITRDPLFHAELFSKFIGENGRLIQIGGLENFKALEKVVMDQIKKSQIEAARFYRAIRMIKPQIQKAIKKHRLRKLMFPKSAL